MNITYKKLYLFLIIAIMLSGCASLRRMKEDSTYAAEFTSGKHPIGFGYGGYYDPKALEAERQKRLEEINSAAKMIDFANGIDETEARVIARIYWAQRNSFILDKSPLLVIDKDLFWEVREALNINDSFFRHIYIDKMTGGIEETNPGFEETAGIKETFKKDQPLFLNYKDLDYHSEIDQTLPKLFSYGMQVLDRPINKPNEKIETKFGIVSVGMSKVSLYKIFSPLQQRHHQRIGNEEWFIFNNIATDEPEDEILFYLSDRKIKGWTKILEKEDAQFFFKNVRY